MAASLGPERLERLLKDASLLSLCTDKHEQTSLLSCVFGPTKQRHFFLFKVSGLYPLKNT